jgi:ABC-type antimicrobial peptide transport system permease subunit
VKAVMHVDNDADPRLAKVVNIYVSCYISGIENMNRLRVRFPEIYEDIFNLEKSYKQEVTIRTLMNNDHMMNKSVFENILNDFQKKLEQEFSSMFTQSSIAELKQDLIASWLADCSMEFWSA